MDFHSVEDTGISLGMALQKALGDCKGIRYAFSYVQWMNPWQEFVRYCRKAHLVTKLNCPIADRNFDCDLIHDFSKPLRIIQCAQFTLI